MPETGYVKSDGLRIYWEKDTPESTNVIDQVVIIHGVGEHLGRHAWLADGLAANGFAVTRFDLRGCGRSEGLRGHVERFNDYFHDIQAVAATIPAQRLVILGQSMGGLIATAFALAHPEQVKGLVLCSPCFGLQMQPAAWKESAARLFSKIAPRMRMKNDLPLEGLCHNQNVVQAYRIDPLCYNKVSPRWYTELQKTMEQTNGSAERISVPMLVLVGDADPIVNTTVTQAFYNKVTIADKHLEIFPGAYHEVFNEDCRELAFCQLVDWLTRHS